MANNPKFHCIVEFVPSSQLTAKISNKPPAKLSNKRHMITDSAKLSNKPPARLSNKPPSKLSYKPPARLSNKPPAKLSNKRHLITDSAKAETTTRTSYEDKFSGFTTQFDKKHMVEGFVNRNTGCSGFKEEMKYKSTMKVDNKWSGCTHEYSVEVKLEKATTYQPPARAVLKCRKKRAAPY